MVEAINNDITRFDPWKDFWEFSWQNKRRLAPINGAKACYMRFPTGYHNANGPVSKFVIAWNLILRDGFLPLRNIRAAEETIIEEEPAVEKKPLTISFEDGEAVEEEQPVIWRPIKKEEPVVATPIVTPLVEEEDDDDVEEVRVKDFYVDNTPTHEIDLELLSWITHIPKENTRFSFYTAEPVDVTPESPHYNQEFNIISKKVNVEPIRCRAKRAKKHETFELLGQKEVKKEQKEMFAELIIARATSGDKAKKVNITEVKDMELKRIIIAMAKDKAKVVDHTPKTSILYTPDISNQAPIAS